MIPCFQRVNFNESLSTRKLDSASPERDTNVTEVETPNQGDVTLINGKVDGQESLKTTPPTESSQAITNIQVCDQIPEQTNSEEKGRMILKMKDKFSLMLKETR